MLQVQQLNQITSNLLSLVILILFIVTTTEVQTHSNNYVALIPINSKLTAWYKLNSNPIKIKCFW